MPLADAGASLAIRRQMQSKYARIPQSNENPCFQISAEWLQHVSDLAVLRFEVAQEIIIYQVDNNLFH